MVEMVGGYSLYTIDAAAFMHQMTLLHVLQSCVFFCKDYSVVHINQLIY